MANLNVNNKNFLPFRLNNNSFWDFYLCKSDVSIYNYKYNGLYDNCLVTEINTNDPDCFIDESLISNNYFWDKSINNGIHLVDIGVTGVDNGLIPFDKDTQKVVDVFTKSELEIGEKDYRFSLRPIDGFYHNMNYEVNKDTENGLTYSSLKGGFYQGFYKLFGYDYQVLPNKPNVEWCWEFLLRPKNGEYDNTLNNIYPNNKGIFFFMGLRAENKFYYFNKNEITYKTSSDYFLDDYLESDENNDIDLNEVVIPETSNGIPYNENYTVIETDNKYLVYNRTKEGITVKTEPDSDIYHIKLKKRKNNNKYLTYNRTKEGMLAGKEDNDDLYDNSVDMVNDSQHNCLAFLIKDDGSIGYRYYNNKCDDDPIIEEYSKPNLVTYDEWNYIAIRLVMNEYIDNPECSNKQRKCKLYFYIKDKLKFVSKEFDEPIFKALNEIKEKQESVPFNISLGGGSLGLFETILSDDDTFEREHFPIEKNFAGTFYGDIMKFRFNDCKMDYSKILNNYVFECNYLKKYNIYY